MLSPASFRVCCLAVMAPALTKADRRADCLPVVLPFCVSKTADPENRKDNDYNLAKFQKIACWLNKRKYMNKAWFRAYVRNTSELSDKNRYSQIDLRKSLLSSKLRINAEARNKSWHGTNVTLAVADKVRLKYTMNKNNNSIRNMGLARANTSLGLHSMKKMNRITQLPHRDKGNPSNLTHELGESSPELPDSANAELETPYRIVKLVQGQSTDEVSSSSDLNCNMAPSKENALSTLNPSSDIVSVSVNSDVPLSTSPNDVEASLCDSNLSVILTDSKCSLNTAENLDSGIVKLPVPETNCIQLLLPEEEDTPVSDTESKATSVIEEESLVLPHLSNEDIVQEDSNFKDSELHDSSVDHLNCIASLPSPLCDVHVQDDIADITASLEARTSPFSIPSPCSPSRLSNDGSDAESDSLTSSTLSADASPIPSSVEEGVEKVFITFPDSFLASPSGVHKELAAPAFSDVACLSIDNSDFIGSDDEMHIMRKTCCPPADQDLSFFRDRLIEHERKISSTLKETEALLRMHSMDHIQQQIRSFVQHFQKKLMIPCQRQHKMGISKSNRNLVDLKAELLQNEDVKNLSTAALVSLVRTWSNPSTGNLPQQNAILQDSELRNKLISTFTPEDIDDVKNASKIFLKNMKKLLQSADPELTESSDDGSSDLEQSEESPAQKKALWKFMKQRAALASRATLLTAKIRELENQLRTVAGYLTKVNSSYGDLRFEDQRTSTTTTLPIFVSESSGDVSLESAMKLNKPKSLNRPVNGYLDHGPINNTIHVGTTNSYDTSVCLEQKLSNRIDAEDTCSRTRALKTSNFHKRKLLVTTGLHLTNPKSAKLSTVNCVCNCQDAILPCILCTGRYNCIQSVDPDSMPLLDRVALLDPPFHPHLSFEKDISLLMHFENILKKNEAQYQSERSASPSSHRRLSLGTKQRHLNDTKSHGRKLKRYSHLSEKYRKKKKHFRKHKLVFGKWRKFQNKIHARDRFRRFSVASSCSSLDSPVPSPMSFQDDGSGFDGKRRRDDNQFDIDDVIIPYSNKRGRLVKFEFKDIEIPSWRSIEYDKLQSIDMEEDTSDTAYIKRHESYEVEERKIIRTGGGALCFFNTWQKRARRQHRSDSRADSSGANTPDPTLICDQDILFQDTNSMHANGPLSPALSPPNTPSSSAQVISDDSQQALGKKKSGGAKRQEESSNFRASIADYDEISPYERRTFPLSEDMMEELIAEYDHSKEDTDVTASGPSCPASPASSTSTTSTIDEDDITDPEWRVVRKESGPEQALVLKFAKR